MKSFKDSEGREWLIHVNVSAVKRVRDLTKVDLPGLIGEGLGKLLEDPVEFVNVLYVLVKPQADSRNPPVTDEEFGAALGGDTLERAADAFVEELIDFFPAPRRQPLRELMKKARQVSDLMLTRASERIAALDPEELAGPSGGSSGDTPGPSASTPDPSPSES